MRCPRCNRSTLSATRGGRNKPRVCAECGGIWVPRGKVEHVGETEALYSLLASDIDEADADACRCPNGHGVLSRAKVDLVPPFRLDRCHVCHGIWFDKGEWERVSAGHLVDHLPEMWTRSWRRQQRLERSQRRYREWAREHFGERLMAELERLGESLTGHACRTEALAFLREISAGDEPED